MGEELKPGQEQVEWKAPETGLEAVAEARKKYREQLAEKGEITVGGTVDQSQNTEAGSSSDVRVGKDGTIYRSESTQSENKTQDSNK